MTIRRAVLAHHVLVISESLDGAVTLGRKSCSSSLSYPNDEKGNAMNVQDIVNTVSQKAGLDEPTTEKVVGTIFSVLEHEAEGTSVSSFFAQIPGADALAQKYDVMAAGAAASSGGGLLSSLQGALGGVLGEKAGALINGVAALKASGLDMAQIQKAGTTLIQQAEAAAGPDLTNQVLDQVPSLRGHLGL